MTSSTCRENRSSLHRSLVNGKMTREGEAHDRDCQGKNESVTKTLNGDGLFSASADTLAQKRQQDSRHEWADDQTHTMKARGTHKRMREDPHARESGNETGERDEKCTQRGSNAPAAQSRPANRTRSYISGKSHCEFNQDFHKAFEKKLQHGCEQVFHTS